MSLDALRKTVRQFCLDEVYPLAEQIDRDDSIPSALWKKMGQAGLLGITVDPNYGGRGMGFCEHLIVVEELSRASGSVGMAYADHSNICLHNLFQHTNPAQRERYIAKLCSGEYLGALSMSEPTAGSDIVGCMSCQAEKKSGFWLANGTKKWTTNGSTADVIIVYMRTKPESSDSHSISAFIIDKEISNWSRGPKEDKLGMRGADNCELYFNQCEIPFDRLLGQEHEGVKILMAGLDSERLLLSGGPIGLMQAALDLVLPYVRERKQFGQPIGRFELMQAKITDMYVALQTARSYSYRTAQQFDAGKGTRKDAAACVLYASQAAVRVALETIQALGGIGYLNSSVAGRILRDAKLYEIGGGTNEIRQMLIGRELFKADPTVID